MSTPSHDPSIENEPQWKNDAFEPDPTQRRAERRVDRDALRAPADDVVEQTVWDEPALSPELAPPDHSQHLTYARWLDVRCAATPPLKTWTTTLLVVLAAGPWGIVGALLSSFEGVWGVLSAVITAPVVEEMTKVALPLWIVEKRPYLFRSSLQILVCCVASGLAFALVENLMYLNLPRDGEPLSPDYATWRWTVCTALHGSCSFLAGIGLARMWTTALNRRERPEIAFAAPCIVGAMICHGLYNGLVTAAEVGGWLKF